MMGIPSVATVFHMIVLGDSGDEHPRGEDVDVMTMHYFRVNPIRLALPRKHDYTCIPSHLVRPSFPAGEDEMMRRQHLISTKSFPQPV